MKQGLVYGLITAAVTIVYTVILTAAGQGMNWLLGLFGIVILIGGIVMGQLAAKKTEDPYGYGKALLVGVVIAVMVAVLGSVYNYINLTYISPETLDEMIEVSASQMSQFGLPEDQIQASVEGITPGSLTMRNLIGGTVIGGIIALISAAFTRKKA